LLSTIRPPRIPCARSHTLEHHCIAHPVGHTSQARSRSHISPKAGSYRAVLVRLNRTPLRPVHRPEKWVAELSEGVMKGQGVGIQYVESTLSAGAQTSQQVHWSCISLRCAAFFAATDTPHDCAAVSIAPHGEPPPGYRVARGAPAPASASPATP